MTGILGVFVLGLVLGSILGFYVAMIVNAGPHPKDIAPALHPPPPVPNLPASPLRECNVCHHMYKPGSARASG